MPDDTATRNISPGWVMVNATCHPDDIQLYPKSFTIQMTCRCLNHLNDLTASSISTGRLTTNFVCHPDDVHFYAYVFRTIF